MNRFLLAALWVAVVSVGAYAQSLMNLTEAKKAILMVHFGTTFDDTRSVTIDAINSKVRAAFPDFDVFEAYTSRIVIKRLKDRGINKQTPKQALLTLAADGYTHVVVQGTNVIDGIEAEVLRKEAGVMAPFFKEIRVGRPLLYSISDGEDVVKILSERYAEHCGKASAVILVGHGTSTPANAMYSQIDYMFGAAGNHDIHVATVEGYPTYETTLAKLKSGKIKNVTLVPFMFVAGDHARNDIDVEWRALLEDEGYSVGTIIEGLGQIPQIQDIYIRHINDAIESPIMDAAQQKAEFISNNI